MTDGQSFYFILALFYLIECVKFAPPSSIGLVSLLGRIGSFSPRHPLLMAWGMKKSVFLAPILPVPSILYIVPPHGEKSHNTAKLKSVNAIRHYHRFLKKATRTLRTLALLNLANFFLILPILYVRTHDERIILYTLAYSYATLLLTANHYHFVHRRLFPRQKADRFKTSIYTALLPWHAPRCTDEVFIKASQRWSPLATLAANIKQPSSLATLQRLWRDSHFKKQPAYKTETLATLLASAGIDPAAWLATPTHLDSPQYCPCCHSGYESAPTHCADCQGVSLSPNPNAPTPQS